MSQMAMAFPALFTDMKKKEMKGIKVGDMNRYLSGDVEFDQTLLHADGFLFKSGWYFGREIAQKCVVTVTACFNEDVDCQDRHAMQRLIRGPFKAFVADKEEKRIIGVPTNLKHAILNLPHAFAPRLDAGIHLRCQFKHFEALTGVKGTEAERAAGRKEENDWLSSTDVDKGVQLFKLMEDKIMAQLPNIWKTANDTNISHRNKLRRRMEYIGEDNTDNGHIRRYLTLIDKTPEDIQQEKENEESPYTGTESYTNDINKYKAYIYISSDNEKIKESFAKYLQDHKNIAVMRLHNNGQIMHGKDISVLKKAGNNTGVMDLALDWYALSLSNFMFAW
eukprot:CAMPEP_0119038304 /NCGR_PEP_ID=MMETSP1177-20130426/7133_1 /TAXON_ID=2985 /ORGANISM="Ochromonas sp, Strain CCMP1899" /LENGTH=334 /DNA_ID=CAMNT_0007000701 /DNA_START=439 /DNA_END=1440 /DNA_ORIENTATION=+